jgi:hypothetical protein
MVVAVTKKIPHPVFSHAKHLGIILRHPSRTRPARRGQDHALPSGMQTVEDLGQPNSNLPSSGSNSLQEKMPKDITFVCANGINR